ncbi:JPH1 isoform 2 [Pongo abelii]|uniref:JPH1 isoform 2 n=1 Tax=Pongo abelii TaxID=9601 RepID=A0A2J8VA16_PONAB|nr:JPH1 isoform 2 [Pongo abelii]
MTGGRYLPGPVGRRHAAWLRRAPERALRHGHGDPLTAAYLAGLAAQRAEQWQRAPRCRSRRRQPSRHPRRFRAQLPRRR